MLDGTRQSTASLMPTRTVEDQNSMRVIRHLILDFHEMFVHRLGVDGGHYDRRSNASVGAYRTKQMYEL